MCFYKIQIKSHQSLQIDFCPLSSVSTGLSTVLIWLCTNLLIIAINVILITVCGIGLVVEHVLAKDETGVRFSYAAP